MAEFLPTRWSVVRAAGRGDEAARAALQTLCETYWYPVYGYLRRRGTNHEDALDWTQGLFTALIERDEFARADPERGRFRTFLLACLRHYVSTERKRELTLKRGEGANVSLDGELAERRFEAEGGEDDPERAFDRAFAKCLLERVLASLAHEWTQAGKGELFAALRAVVLLDDEERVPYAELAARFDSTETALRGQAHRLRLRYRELLRREVLETLGDEKDLEEELRALFRSVEG